MSKSLDARTQVLAAMLSGLSCRQAAIRFGVSASSASPAGRWNGCRATRSRRRLWRDRRSIRLGRRAGAHSRAGRCDPGHHARRAQDGARRATRLASYGALWRFFHRHKITRKKDRARHEQDRADMVSRRAPGSMASWNLDRERHVFNTATPDLDQHLPPVRMVAEMAKGSESAFPMSTPKQRPLSLDCTLTKSSPRWFWTIHKRLRL
jgi:hypothetical protein